MAVKPRIEQRGMGDIWITKAESSHFGEILWKQNSRRSQDRTWGHDPGLADMWQKNRPPDFFSNVSKNAKMSKSSFFFKSAKNGLHLFDLFLDFRRSANFQIFWRFLSLNLTFSLKSHLIREFTFNFFRKNPPFLNFNFRWALWF